MDRIEIEETRRQGGDPPDVVSTDSAPHGTAGAVTHVNEIVLVGRLSGVPEWKSLPGGGQVAVWRLIVEHRDARSPQDAIDTIRCVTYDPSVQEGVRDWRHGDVIEVRGSLRHRFWRGPNGPRGLYEVEAVIVLRRQGAGSGSAAPA
ncbi:single-stranded DNA-binding protein [Actinoallomurus rhizosphaericola]|uniref:single-stranded DNA-binding protein n=1 Tax=Actinoallomurus rhizosphaericola TaxID=2952536 RepID=UPI0020921E37|nr:single-stranded DNA-binding protein [Actinoallomurus rhizosphaericola]MCO5999413.1 single-stranded DNA-binding protein [Actinoallomurus rhizosphaericola]